MPTPEEDSQFMLRALQLAELGRGAVEPNPLVGCVIVREGTIVGEGWHQRFGAAHAEVNALAAAGEQARDADLYVTLEPCRHFGKTPPCTNAVIQAGVRRVIAAMRDPFPQVAGGGIDQLRSAGLTVEVGLHEDRARELNAPYLKRLSTARPWVIAKWAMTLDGKIATRTGHSKWISSPEARGIVHRLRGRMDAIVVGRRTAELDDPELLARPAEVVIGAEAGTTPESFIRRTALRVVLDSQARLPLTLKLVRTARQFSTLIAVGPEAPAERMAAMRERGCEVLQLPGETHSKRFAQLLDELGRRQMTNILLEGGAELLGAAFDSRLVDEVHAFIAPRIFGGQTAPSPVGGRGIDLVKESQEFRVLESLSLANGDLFLAARIK